MTAITPELLAAYRETEYRVGGERPFVLRIGHASVALRQLHKRHGVACSAFLTAVNPRSQLCDAASNTTRLSALKEQLRGLGLRTIEGVGQHPTNGWPLEASVLALGLDQATATQIGHQWEQNAIVCCNADAIPRLVLLR